MHGATGQIRISLKLTEGVRIEYKRGACVAYYVFPSLRHNANTAKVDLSGDLKRATEFEDGLGRGPRRWQLFCRWYQFRICHGGGTEES